MALNMGPSTRNADQAAFDSRVSWGAIIAGAVCALALQVVFTLITAGLGLSMVEDGDFSGAGWGTGLFFALTAIASLFAGGAVAGRLSNQPFLPAAVIHGIVVWALVLLGAVWLSVSATGTILSGAARTAGAAGEAAAGVAGGTAEAAGGAISALAPDLEEIDMPDMESLVPRSVEQDMRQILGDTDLTPTEIREVAAAVTTEVIDDGDISRARAIVAGAGRAMLRDPSEADEIFESAVDRLTAPDGPLGEAQFDELQAVLQDRYGLGEEKTAELVAGWRTEFVETRDAAVETWRQTWSTMSTELDEAAQAAAEVAEDAAEAAASAAWWTAVGGLLGLAAAAIGAAISRPEDITWRAPHPASG
jgi:hypothetical protein